MAPPPCLLWVCGGPVLTCMGSVRFPLGHGVRRGGAGDATVRSGKERRLAALCGQEVVEEGWRERKRGGGAKIGQEVAEEKGRRKRRRRREGTRGRKEKIIALMAGI